MAVRINAGDDVTRGDMFFVNPFNIVVKEELRGRHIAPDSEAIVLLAISMLSHGQQQAVSARRMEDKRLLLTSGFTRNAAARLIRTGFDHDGEHYEDPEFKLQVKLSDCNDETALERNIVENCHRNDTSAIDDAHNQDRLRERYGRTDAEITRLYGYNNPNKVGQLKKLLSLSDEEQQLVHDGNLSVNAALNLLTVDSEKRAEIVAAATKDSGKIDGSVVTSQVRDVHLNDDNNDGADAIFGDTSDDDAEPAKKITRSMREVKNYLGACLDDETFVDFHDVCKTMLGFIAGTKSERQMDNAFKRLPLKQTRKAA